MRNPNPNNISELTDRPDSVKRLITIRDEIERLARLDDAGCAEERDSVARVLDISVGSLDKHVANALRRIDDQDNGQPGSWPPYQPIRWDRKVAGDTLLDDLRDAFLRHVAMQPDYADTLALWALHCHVYPCFTVTPRLWVTSPLPGCGKTLVFDILASLTPRAVRADHVTPAAVFRMIDEHESTLLIDEADTFLNSNRELRGVLDSGHRKGGNIGRAAGPFKTFSPLAIAGLGKIHPALIGRSITIELRRRLPEEEITYLTPDQHLRLKRLNRKSARWAEDHRATLCSAPVIPPDVTNRNRDNWLPLLSIAEAAGGEWPRRARKLALRATTAEHSDTDSRVLLLRDIRTIFNVNGGDRLASQSICENLLRMEDRPWPQWKAGKPITPHGVAALLERFKIRPATVRAQQRTFKGYRREQFEDAWKRYA